MEKSNRVSVSSGLVLSVSVAALFAAVAIVLGLEPRVIHPFTAVTHAACALLTAAGLVRGFLRTDGAAQKRCMGIGLVLVTAFAAFAVWNGYFSPVFNAVLLPVAALFAVAAFPVLTGGAAWIFKKAWFYILIVATVVALLFAQLGVTHMLPEASDGEDSAVTETVGDTESGQIADELETDVPTSGEAQEEHKGVPAIFFVAWGLVLVFIVCAVVKYVRN